MKRILKCENPGELAVLFWKQPVLGTASRAAQLL